MMKRLLAALACLCTILLCDLNAQTPSKVTFSRTVIPRPRSVPNLHYWTGIDDQNRGIVVLKPDPAGATSPGPNGYGIVIFVSTGYDSHPDSFWAGDGALNPFQPYLAQGYTVYIVTHPPSSFPNGSPNEPIQPGYTASELREFHELSVMTLKQDPISTTAIFSGPPGARVSEVHEPKHWGIIGGSSGANLALNVALQQPSYRKSVIVNSKTIDTSFGAFAGGSTGCDLYNWRFPGDSSYAWKIANGLVHPDLSDFSDPTLPPPGGKFPAPSSLTLPSQTPPTINGPVLFPLSQLPNDDQMLQLPHSRALPESYVKFLPGGTVNSLANEREFPIELWFQDDVSPDDETFNSNLLIPEYSPALPGTWGSFLVGHRMIDYLHDIIPPNAPVDPSFKLPPIYWVYGELDSVVPPYQAQLFSDTMDAVPALNKSEFLIYGRPEQYHAWRDIDGKQQEEFVAFMNKHLRGIHDSDWDGLEDNLDVGFTLDPDRDGDGQKDGNEYLDAGPSPTVPTIGDPSKSFRITEIKKTLTALRPAVWQVEITFEGYAPNPTTGSYVLQSTTSLITDNGAENLFSLNGQRFYPNWKDVTATVTFAAAATGPNRYTATFSRGTLGPSDEKFYRIALVEPGSPFRRVTTAPVGLERGTIPRDTSVPIKSLICSGFMNPDVWRGKISSASAKYLNTASGYEVVDFGVPSGSFSSPLGLASNSPASEVDDFLYYAIVQEDAEIVSKRPVPNPDDQGFAGHWWFVDEATTGTRLTVKDRESATLASNLPVGSSVAVRKLISLADLFQGLEGPMGTSSWYKSQIVDSSGMVGTTGSPFVSGDIIQFVPRQRSSVEWTLPGSFMRDTLVPSVELFFESTPSTNYGVWRRYENGLVVGPPVDLSDYRLRPDEACYYIAAPSTPSEGATDGEYWTSGLVSTSDVIAYVDAVATKPSGDPYHPTGAQTGIVYYATSVVGWPFPQDSRLFTILNQSSHFFESGLTTDSTIMGTDVAFFPNPPSSTNAVPPTSVESTVLLYSDRKDPLYNKKRGDDPPQMRVVWGGFEGQRSYWDPPTATIRTIDLSVLSDNLNGGSIAREKDGLWIRAGRGTLVLSNTASSDPTIFKEWRMRRPYRKP